MYTWELKGDSLFLRIDPQSYEINIDDSCLILEEGGQDSLKVWINEYRDKTLKQCSEAPAEKLSVSFKARLDSSRDKMEWTGSDKTVRYLKRQR